MGCLKLTYRDETSPLRVVKGNLKCFEESCLGSYRYGFNGMEGDPEVKGAGNHYTTHFRQYDPRLGRWMSIDPLADRFPWQSPYAAFNNNPIYFEDARGDSSKTGNDVSPEPLYDAPCIDFCGLEGQTFERFPYIDHLTFEESFEQNPNVSESEHREYLQKRYGLTNITVEDASKIELSYIPQTTNEQRQFGSLYAIKYEGVVLGKISVGGFANNSPRELESAKYQAESVNYLKPLLNDAIKIGDWVGIMILNEMISETQAKYSSVISYIPFDQAGSEVFRRLGKSEESLKDKALKEGAANAIDDLMW